ncbi:MAG: ankyrin repeat domain-containing protein [Candidatus Krumholzibacteria bacterium]|nr:ankyrin repeat domain-containing protein [Candidatus Krumholzibacteria bacterium]
MRTVRLVSIVMILLFLAAGVAAGEIHEAVRGGNIQAVRQLVAADRSILATKEADGSTPLHIAAQSGNLDMTKLLLDLGADVKLGDNENSNALHVAAIGANTAVIDLLLAKGMDVNSADVNGMTAVLFAGSRGKWDAVQYLASKGARLDCRATGGTGLVHFAARRGNLDVLKQLVAAGLSLSCGPDQWGATPLGGAAQRGQMEVMTFLLENGANPNEVPPDGESPLMNAAGAGKRDAVRLLLDKGADPNYRLNEFTALMASFWRPDPEVVRMLLAKGADVKLTGETGSNVLHRFAQTPNVPVEIARLLVEAGADPTKRNDEGFTPLTLACERGYTDIVKYFASKGADVSNAGGAFKSTGLHAAAAKGYGDLATFLIESGAPVNAEDSDGHTPLYYADRHGNTEIAKALKAKGGKGGCRTVAAAELLSKRIPEGEAIVFYTGHSGWAIETANNFLIFDFVQDGRASDAPGILNGCINPAELKGKKVTAFVSHTVHPDHYSKANFAWNVGIGNITWVFGQRPDTTVAVELIDPRQTKNVNGMEIVATRSTDAGVAFLVTVDGLTILHSGDLHNRDANIDGVYSEEINYLAGLGHKIDMAFIPVSGCGFGDQETMKKGVWWGVEKLDPASVFWMHGGSSCSRYTEFSAEAAKAGCTVPQGLPRLKGDRFTYKDGQLKAI